jgi:tetratricopeptide (TPR) repeat protein
VKRAEAVHGLPDMARGGSWSLGVACVFLMFAACAVRVAPPLPATLAYPDFVYPVVAADVWSEAASGSIDRGWRYLQNNDLQSAQTEFLGAGGQGFYPARAGEGYVALARTQFGSATEAFDAALLTAPGYVPALVGRGQALLGLGFNADALVAFEAAIAGDPTLVDLGRRIDLLRFGVLQEIIDEGRRAQGAGRLGEARVAYLRAIESSPDTAFLYRELGAVELQLGDVDGALERVRRASDLDDSDVETAVLLGEVLEKRGDFNAAIEAYQRASGLGPDANLVERIAIAIGRSRDAMLPAEFHAIAFAQRVTRGDLAALIGIRLDAVLQAAVPLQVVVTDIRAHWAQGWVAVVIRAGVMDEFSNHTFQPEALLRRVDLASAVRRMVTLLADSRPTLRASLEARPVVADVDPGHLSYPDVSTAVASGVMPLVAGRFGVNQFVAGSAALEVIERLQALAGGR